jgi:cyanophycinase
MNKFIFAIMALALLNSCSNTEMQEQAKTFPKGKLFIIGGGHKPPSLIKKMVEVAQMDSTDYVLVVPTASSLIDTAVFYGIKQFTEAGVQKVIPLYAATPHEYTDSVIGLIKKARLIYFSGGDQNNLTRAFLNTPALQAFHEAYINGSTLAGTSAGAAIMSQKMITGDQKKHPVYTGYFKTIEADNMELKDGFGFLKNAIVDQHFIKHQRMNRLIAVSLENPGLLCIGIDESTAIVVKSNSAMVTGKSQVVTIKSNAEQVKISNGLIGGQNLQLSIYLPGEKFSIK